MKLEFKMELKFKKLEYYVRKTPFPIALTWPHIIYVRKKTKKKKIHKTKHKNKKQNKTKTNKNLLPHVTSVYFACLYNSFI